MGAKKLASGRSARWAFMERFEVPDYDKPERNYLTRWRIVQTPWAGLYLHRLDGPDPRPTLHDHPWPFLSIVLRGGYVERRLNPMTMTVDEEHRIRRVNRARAGMAHSIRYLLRQPTWTLLFVGARRRTWGYLEPTEGISPLRDAWTWTEFDEHPHADEFDRALAARRAPVPESEK